MPFVQIPPAPSNSFVFSSNGSGKTPRYYQVNAINATIEAIAKGQNRILFLADRDVEGYRPERVFLAAALLRCRRGWGRFAAEAGGLNMHAAIADKREELAELCWRYDVARLEVFGSAARGTDFDPEKSDADVLVEFESDSRLRPFHRYFDLVGALRNTLSRPVDLVEFGAVRNPYLRAAINESREVVYAS